MRLPPPLRPRVAFGLAVAVASATLLLSACGSTAPTTDTAGSSGGAGGGATTAAPAPSGGPASSAAPSTVSTTVPGPPGAIECLTQYRPDAEVMTGAEEPTLRVERADTPTGASETLSFATMALKVTYLGDQYEGWSVLIDVQGPTKETLVRTLYQIGETDLTTIDLAGGHGFTGLQYVSSGTAQLQVSCAAVA